MEIIFDFMDCALRFKIQELFILSMQYWETFSNLGNLIVIAIGLRITTSFIKRHFTRFSTEEYNDLAHAGSALCIALRREGLADNNKGFGIYVVWYGVIF